MSAPTTRTCDALGICQAHTTPCNGCDNSHPAYHHLHRVHAMRRACQADKCSQGRAACPVPQACEVPDATDAGHPGSEAGCARDVAWPVLMAIACITFAALVMEMALGA